MIGLATAAQAFLGLIVDAAADEGVTLPSRRYVAAGAAGGEAHDCEQVTVALVQLGSGLAVQQADLSGRTGDPASAGLPSAALRAEIVRLHPALDDDGNPPTAGALNTAGVAAMVDAALLHVVRSRLMVESPLTPESTDARVGPVLPAGPSGKVTSTTLTVTVTLV